MIERPLDQPPHALPPAAVVAHFGTDPVRGLTRSEAVRRLTIAGPNELPAAAQVPAWRILYVPGTVVLGMVHCTVLREQAKVGKQGSRAHVYVVSQFQS